MTSLKRRSLFRKLLLFHLLPILLILIIVGLVFSFKTGNSLIEQAKEETIHEAKSVNLLIQQGQLTTEELRNQLVFLGEAFNKKLMLFDRNGKVIASSMTEEVNIGKEVDETIVEKILAGEQVAETSNAEDREHITNVSVAIPWGIDDTLYGGILIQAPVDEVFSNYQMARETMLWVMIASVLLITLLTSYLAWSITRPLKRIEHAATDITLGKYDQQLDYPYSDEIGDLIDTFNRMTASIEEMENERISLEHRRDTFISNISHELRTPLTSMQGFLEALQDGLVSDEASRQKYYRVMYEEVRYLSRLVNDLMDVIKLRNKKVQLDLFYVRIEELLEKVRFFLQSKAKDHGNEIVFDYPQNLPPVLADADRLEQIFKNLIDNANKFTENGVINVDIWAETDNIVIEIRDDGIGIATHELPQIWDRFYKIQTRRSMNDRGTGLGLAIVKELVELHGGTIVVQSKLGEGSTFTVKLPLESLD